MKTVSDTILDALTMKRQGTLLNENTRRLVDIGQGNGFTHINEQAAQTLSS